MEHIAIDLGTRQSQICMRSAKGRVLQETKIKTKDLHKFFEQVDRRCKVVMETCAQSHKVAQWAQALGHEAIVIPGTLVKTLGVGSRGVKTDRKDAQVLSEVSTRIDLPGVHLKTELSKKRLKWISLRLGQVSSRTQLINQVRAYLREDMISIGGGAAKTFAKRVREKFKENLPMEISGHLLIIEHLSAQIQDFDDRIAAEIAQDPQLQLLMTVPGIGPITAMTFAACVDQVARFTKPHHLQSYIGLTPGERSSGLKRRSTSITKAGPSTLRWLLIQSAHAAFRTKTNEPMVVWAQGIAERRGKRIAIVALARKLAGILWSMLRHQSKYQAHKAAKVKKMAA